MLMPSYTSGLLQARAYRLLRSYVNKTLSEFHLTMAEWALVGQLYDQRAGLRFADLATILEVEPPLVTKLVDGLETRKIVTRQEHPDDRRAKVICLTEAGVALVEKVEKIVTQAMRELLRNVSVDDLRIYLKVLAQIADAAGK
jgi:MarR family transcriptional regulator for hemolysin